MPPEPFGRRPRSFTHSPITPRTRPRPRDSPVTTYDFYKLLQSKHKAEATHDLDLLVRVAEHKSIYFRASWANYGEAKKGTLKLAPTARIETLMRRDYEQMQEMIFDEPSPWSDILTGIEKFESEFNS